MDVHFKVTDYYKPGYVDHLYVPYQRHNVNSRHAGKDVKGYLPQYDGDVNTWSQMGPIENLQPDEIQVNWGQTFQRQHTFYPCPVGFTDVGNGFCKPAQLPYNGVFYTDKVIQPRQHHAERKPVFPSIIQEETYGRPVWGLQNKMNRLPHYANAGSKEMYL